MAEQGFPLSAIFYKWGFPAPPQLERAIPSSMALRITKKRIPMRALTLFKLSFFFIGYRMWSILSLEHIINCASEFLLLFCFSERSRSAPVYISFNFLYSVSHSVKSIIPDVSSMRDQVPSYIKHDCMCCRYHCRSNLSLGDIKSVLLALLKDVSVIL